MNPQTSTHPAHAGKTDPAPGATTHTPRAIESGCSLRILIRVFFIGALLLLGLMTVFCLLLD